MNTKKGFLIIFAVPILMLASCAGWKKKVSVKKNQYALKTIDSKQLDQSVDFSAFSDPNHRVNQDSSRLIIYCASGGGARSASFNTGVLLELENIMAEIQGTDQKSNALNEIDYFSTTSGGSWGVSSYIAYLYQKQKYSQLSYKTAIKKYNDSLKDTKSEEIIKDFPTYNDYEMYLQNRSAFRYFKHQAKYIFMPRSSQRSTRIITNRINAGYLGWSYRADVEEKTWKFLHDEKKEPFNNYYVDEICMGDLFKPRHIQTQLPIQIPNTTNIDNYILVPFTPDILNNYNVRDYVHYLKKTPIPIVKSGVFAYDSIPFASGVHASSGIPFAIGPTVFKATKKVGKDSVEYFMHLQDGGIVEQQAMHSAKSILRAHNYIKDPKKRIVIIADASAAGLNSTKKNRKRHTRRLYNGFRMVAPMVAPNVQYPITRERIKLFEEEYNCTVIYLGTELLLSDSLGSQASTNENLMGKKNALTEKFRLMYQTLQNDKTAFMNVNKDDKKLLYAYIEQYAFTSWSSKGGSKGKYLNDKFTGVAMVMYLAGRGVVQLQRDRLTEIMK